MDASTNPRLSRTEWQAVAIALKDAADCGCAPAARGGGAGTRLARLYAALTGSAPRPQLADRRLEAIRRFVCETRRTRRPAERHAGALVAQGFSHEQVAALALLSA